MGEMEMTTITNVITLKQYAERHGLDAKRVRRLARKNEFPGEFTPFKFGSVWAIVADAPAIELPAKSTRGTRRADGRQRHIVFCNTVELTAVRDIVGDDNVIDPRIASKRRRDARKLANELTEMADNATGEHVHPNDVARAAELNAAELTAIEHGNDTLDE